MMPVWRFLGIGAILCVAAVGMSWYVWSIVQDQLVNNAKNSRPSTAYTQVVGTGSSTLPAITSGI